MISKNIITKAPGIGYSLVNPNDPGIYGKNGIAMWDNNIPVTPGDKISVTVEAPDGGVRFIWGNDKYFPTNASIGYSNPQYVTGKEVITANQNNLNLVNTDFTSSNVLYISILNSGTTITLPNMQSTDIGKTICMLSLYTDAGTTTVNKSTNGLMDQNSLIVNSISLTKKQMVLFTFDGTNWLANMNSVPSTTSSVAQAVIYAGLSPAQRLFYGV